MSLTIEHALKIDGWMQTNELQCLAELASKSRNIAEIGSWMGRSTAALAANTIGKVTAIDTWAGSTEIAHKELLESKPENWLFDTFKSNVKDFSNIEPYRLTSYQASKHFKSLGAKFDLIFIDASHDYNSVKTDIVNWMPLLEKGGIFCGHDYISNWPGVQAAVEELIPKFDVVGTIWISKY